MTTKSASVTKVELSFTEADLDRAVAARVREIEGWHEQEAHDVTVPNVHAHKVQNETVERFEVTKPPSVRAVV